MENRTFEINNIDNSTNKRIDKEIYINLLNDIGSNMKKLFDKKKKFGNKELVFHKRVMSDPFDYIANKITTIPKYKLKHLNKNIKDFDPFQSEISQIMDRKARKLNAQEESFFEFHSILK